MISSAESVCRLQTAGNEEKGAELGFQRELDSHLTFK